MCEELYGIKSSDVTQAGQVKGDDPDKKGHPAPPGWGLGVGVRPHPGKKTYVQKTLEMPRMESINRRRTGWKEKELTAAGDKRTEEKSCE
jgi:hypothetical protein